MYLTATLFSQELLKMSIHFIFYMMLLQFTKINVFKIEVFSGFKKVYVLEICHNLIYTFNLTTMQITIWHRDLRFSSRDNHIFQLSTAKLHLTFNFTLTFSILTTSDTCTALMLIKREPSISIFVKLCIYSTVFVLSE